MTTPTPSKTFILQRTVAHYRVPLFEELAKHGWKVISASNFPEGTSGLNTTSSAPFQILTPFFFPLKKNPYICHAPFFKVLREHAPETLIMEAGSTMTSTWLAALYCRLHKKRKTKIILWGHGAPVANKSGWRGKLAYHLKTWLINSVDGYLCYTEKDKGYLDKLNLNTPVFSAGNNTDISQAQKLRKAPEKKSIRNLLFIGRLTKDKKVPQLIHLFKELKTPNLHLNIIGDGSEMPAVQLAAEHVKNVHITGAIYGADELAEYYNNAELFITLGAVGLGVNESIAYGLPVLCYKESLTGPHHHPEIAYIEEGVTGWQVAPHSKDAMLEKLNELLGQPTKANMYESVISYADANLTIEKMAKNILNMEAQI